MNWQVQEQLSTQVDEWFGPAKKSEALLVSAIGGPVDTVPPAFVIVRSPTHRDLRVWVMDVGGLSPEAVEFAHLQAKGIAAWLPNSKDPSHAGRAWSHPAARRVKSGALR